jgi:uncharacterized membrane protein HdeD (DUF308 family)
MALDWQHVWIAVGSLFIGAVMLRMVQALPLAAVSIEARILWAYTTSTILVVLFALADHTHPASQVFAYGLAIACWALAASVLGVMLVLRHRRTPEH